MDHHRRPPSLNLISTSSPARPVSTSPTPLHRQSQSPFRYVHFDQSPGPELDEKATPLSNLTPDRKRSTTSGNPTSSQPNRQAPSHPSASSSRPLRNHYSTPLSGLPSPFLRQPAPLLLPSHTPTYSIPRRLRIANRMKPWTPIIMYGLTSLAFLVAIAMYRTEVFSLLDELSRWLQADKQYGHAVLFLLIFLTTIPPIPLYSTFIILSGYTFGPWTGAIISYFAALSGALIVFIVSRTLLRESISRWLASACTMRRVVRAIEKRPKLLFLIRLAPYPYNVMNCLLAASPTLTLRTYTVCTALSLFKVIIHTSLGASIHSFKDYHVVVPDKDSTRPEGGSGTGAEEEESSADMVARTWTIIGVILCIAIFVYLAIVARRAVDEENDDEMRETPGEERIAFLSPRGTSVDIEVGNFESDMHLTAGSGARGGQAMAESPLRTHQLLPFRTSISLEPDGRGS